MFAGIRTDQKLYFDLHAIFPWKLISLSSTMQNEDGLYLLN